MLKPEQQDRLQRLLDDEQTLKIVEQVFDETLDRNMPQVHFLDSNKRIGEKYRSYDLAKGLIRAAFNDLLSYKVINEKKDDTFNKHK